jgi:hypothetical protein
LLENMVGVAAEFAVQQAKSSHTAVSKSSQLGQRWPTLTGIVP